MESGSPRFVKSSTEWIRSHVLTAMIASAVLGAAVFGGSNDGSMKSELVAANKRVAAAEAGASTADQLASENDELKSEIADLQDQLVKMNATRELPKLTNGDEDEAADLAAEYGWNLHIKRRYSQQPPGSILSQSPAPGTMMRYDAPFVIVVAKKIPKIPSLNGLRQARAVKIAKAAGYRVVVTHEVSDTRPGTVIAVSPSSGSPLVPGRVVKITVAKKAPPPPKPAAPAPAPSNCTPGYDPCLPPASDYDCLGGSGDGPEYTGAVRVTGSDPYDLDADGDGWGCE